MILKNYNINSDTLFFSNLTNLSNGMHLFSLSLSNDELFVDGVYHQGRQIYKVDESGQLKMVKKNA